MDDKAGRVHWVVTNTDGSIAQEGWVSTGPVVGATEDRYLDVRYTVF